MDRGAGSARYAVVGAGRMGCAFAEALAGAGRIVTAVHSQHEASAAALAARLPDALACADLASLVAAADRIVVTVPDAQLAAVAQALPVGNRHAVIHGSGGSSLSVLAACQQRGAAIACFHPLQSFPDRSGGAPRFRGICIGLEASDARLRDELERLVQALGARAIDLTGVDRARYHAAAVFASNYLIALLKAATDAWTAAGLPLDAALPALLPLSQGALDAAARAPLADALTGPIARGDADTVARQLDALRQQPAVRALYRDLARQLLELGLPADSQAREALARLLA